MEISNIAETEGNLEELINGTELVTSDIKNIFENMRVLDSLLACKKFLFDSEKHDSAELDGLIGKYVEALNNIPVENQKWIIDNFEQAVPFFYGTVSDCPLNGCPQQLRCFPQLVDVNLGEIEQGESINSKVKKVLRYFCPDNTGVEDVWELKTPELRETDKEGEMTPKIRYTRTDF